MNEQRCAELIEKARSVARIVPPEFPMIFSPFDDYTADEVRVANETLERLGLPVTVLLVKSFAIR